MMASYLNTWFSKTHAKADIVYYDNFADCSSDFYNKMIDAFVSADNIVSSYTGVFPVEKLAKEPYYLAVAKGHKNLLSELNMSHDIRTPLNGIIGIIDINSKSTDEALIEENRKKAKRAAQQLLNLLNEVLDMSRLETETPIIFKRFSLIL